MPKLDASQLDTIYRDADQIDDKVFSEMRSNILLVSGDHYHKKGTKFWNRIRNSKELTEETKLRLTKNHTEYICNKISENILLFAPKALATPNNEDEIQDQKTASLMNSVWEYSTKEMGFREMTRNFVESFVQLGEVHNKIYWDEEAGRLIGFKPKMSLDGEDYEYGEDGEKMPDKDEPVFSGKLVIEEVLAFNLLRDPDCQDIYESPYYIVRKMISKKRAKQLLAGLPEDEREKAMGSLGSDYEESYLVFDGDKAQYNKEKNMVMVREHYYRPSREYPNGYFFITLMTHVLAEGELPYGVWPFVSKGYNKIKTSARYRSPIKTIRPYQIEINRCASAIATHQVTLGDDKLILNHGSKISHGGKLSGVRAISVTGGNDPKILSGRSGEQYVPWLQQNISELYNVMDIPEGDPIKEGQLDPYAMLYLANKNREKFRKYGEAFEEFIVETAELYLDLARRYLDENHLIPMIGKSEYVNIAEFKHAEPNRFRIKVQAVSDDSNTMLGKQLSINHMMQYVSGQLSNNQIGMMIRNMPLLNGEEMSQDLTINYDNVNNDFLAMERGEQPQMNNYDDHQYCIQRASNRMRKPDFKLLDPMVQQMYQQYIQMHEQMEMENMQAKQRLEDGYIPTDGPLVTVDYYVADENGDTKRAKIPQRAIEWLEQQLASQGTDLAKLEEMNQGALAEMVQNFYQNPQGALPQG